jgi:hypothetical protein
MKNKDRETIKCLKWMFSLPAYLFWNNGPEWWLNGFLARVHAGELSLEQCANLVTETWQYKIEKAAQVPRKQKKRSTQSAGASCKTPLA